MRSFLANLYIERCYCNRVRLKDMNDKKSTEVVTKTYGSSWIITIIIGLILGMVGYLISPTAQGFIVGFVIAFICELMVLVSMIPYVGIYLQWVWSLQICNWVVSLGNFTVSQSATFSTLLMFPLIFAMIFGAIIFLVFTSIVTVGIIAILGAIFG
jgi:hypothetical protein